LGCIFCHNPDSWRFDCGEEIDVAALMRRLDRYRPFLRAPGLTISGGEPMAQPQFTRELMVAARSEGWHVALDTSGWGRPDEFVRVTQSADMVIFSIKHALDPQKLAPQIDVDTTLANWRSLARSAVPVWLRYVLIPGWTDGEEALKALGRAAAELPNLDRIEVLPLNRLAAAKWAELGKTSPVLSGVCDRISEQQLTAAEETIASVRLSLVKAG
jgi:pyruvate formate lyase activating enzyme